jgi:hypothetical protein
MRASDYFKPVRGFTGHDSAYEVEDVEELLFHLQELQLVAELVRDCHYEGADFGARDKLNALPWFDKKR